MDEINPTKIYFDAKKALEKTTEEIKQHKQTITNAEETIQKLIAVSSSLQRLMSDLQPLVAEEQKPELIGDIDISHLQFEGDENL